MRNPLRPACAPPGRGRPFGPPDQHVVTGAGGAGRRACGLLRGEQEDREQDRADPGQPRRGLAGPEPAGLAPEGGEDGFRRLHGRRQQVRGRQVPEQQVRPGRLADHRPKPRVRRPACQPAGPFGPCPVTSGPLPARAAVSSNGGRPPHAPGAFLEDAGSGGEHAMTEMRPPASEREACRRDQAAQGEARPLRPPVHLRRRQRRPDRHLGVHRLRLFLADLPAARLGHRHRVPRLGRVPRPDLRGGDPAGDASTALSRTRRGRAGRNDACTQGAVDRVQRR